MDDESYFTLTKFKLTGNNSFYSNVSKTSNDVKYYNKQNMKKRYWYG